MIRQRVLFAGILLAVVSVVASSGDADARGGRCHGQRGNRNMGWRQNSGYYAQTNYATTPAVQQPMATPTIAPDPNAPVPPSQAPAPAPATQPAPTI